MSNQTALSKMAIQYADYILNHYSRHSIADKICLARELERQRNDLRKQNAKLRDIAERAIANLPIKCGGSFDEYQKNNSFVFKLRAELDQLKEKTQIYKEALEVIAYDPCNPRLDFQGIADEALEEARGIARTQTEEGAK